MSPEPQSATSANHVHLHEIDLREAALKGSTDPDHIAGLTFWAEQHRRAIEVSLATPLRQVRRRFGTVVYDRDGRPRGNSEPCDPDCAINQPSTSRIVICDCHSDDLGEYLRAMSG